MHWHSSYISIYSILIQGLHGKRCPIVCRRKQKIPFRSLKYCLLIGQQIRVDSKLGLSESGIFKSWMKLTMPVWTKWGVNKWKFTPKVSCGYLSWKKYDSYYIPGLLQIHSFYEFRLFSEIRYIYNIMSGFVKIREFILVIEIFVKMEKFMLKTKILKFLEINLNHDSPNKFALFMIWKLWTKMTILQKISKIIYSVTS